MTKLEITVNENKEAYLEYQGKRLEYVHDEAWRNDAEDIFDMNPASRAGFAKRVDSFVIGGLKEEIVSDSDNLAHSFEFYAEDIDDESFKIIMKYYLPRGGRHEVEVGYIK